MAKKKKDTEPPFMEDFLQVATENAEKEFGAGKCFDASQLEGKINVVPVPAFALCWLLSINGWPLGRFTQAGGNKGTFKSSFGFQLLQWFLDAGGIGLHIDSENKTSPTLMWSILDHKYGVNGDSAMQRRIRFHHADSINEWQRMVTQSKQSLDTVSEKRKGQKPDFPILWTVDSILGAGSKETKDHIKKEGEAQGRGYKDDPLLLKNFLQGFPSDIREWPITLHAVHHEKPGFDGGALNWGGGLAPEFYSSLALRFRKSKGNTAYGVTETTNRAQLKGHTIRITIRKSSVGPDVGRELLVPILWKFEPDPVTNLDRQITWWDWSSATAMILHKDADKLEKDLGLDIHHVSKQAGAHFWSEALGVSESSPEPASIFGRMVDRHPEWRRKLEDHYHVHRYQYVGSAQAMVEPEPTPEPAMGPLSDEDTADV